MKGVEVEEVLENIREGASRRSVSFGESQGTCTAQLCGLRVAPGPRRGELEGGGAEEGQRAAQAALSALSSTASPPPLPARVSMATPGPGPPDPTASGFKWADEGERIKLGFSWTRTVIQELNRSF